MRVLKSCLGVVQRSDVAAVDALALRVAGYDCGEALAVLLEAR
jgi:hypothetical protein